MPTKTGAALAREVVRVLGPLYVDYDGTSPVPKEDRDRLLRMAERVLGKAAR